MGELMEKKIIKSTKEFAKANDIPFNKVIELMILNAIRETAVEIRQSITVNFDDFLTQQYGEKGTVKRALNDRKLKKLETEQVKKARKTLKK